MIFFSKLKTLGMENYHKNNKTSSSRDALITFGLWKTWFFHSCDGILFQVWCFSRESGPGPFLLFLKAHAVPMMGKTGALPLPVLEERHSCVRSNLITFPFSLGMSKKRSDLFRTS